MIELELELTSINVLKITDSFHFILMGQFQTKSNLGDKNFHSIGEPDFSGYSKKLLN